MSEKLSFLLLTDVICSSDTDSLAVTSFSSVADCYWATAETSKNPGMFFLFCFVFFLLGMFFIRELEVL